MGYAALPTKNPGDTLTSALWNTYLQGNADSGFMRMLADTTLGVAAASIDFTSIPQTFAHLMLALYGRGDTAVVNQFVRIRFNNDSGANYDYQEIHAAAAAVTASEGLAQTSAVAGVCPGAPPTARRQQLALNRPACGRRMVALVNSLRASVSLRSRDRMADGVGVHVDGEAIR